MRLLPRRRCQSHPLATGLLTLTVLCGAQTDPANSPTQPKTVTTPAAPKTASAASKHKHTNRLAKEKSPYLLQHAHNPVDWFPWGEEAFTKARKEGKPILLSIGYSTCHWCHVMERESFESEEVAKFLNAHFVSIKVDREERPDVDKIYMTAVQAMGQGGGWPLNVFLTPDLKPFYGGTYFPPQPKFGRPSFTQLLERVNEIWQTRSDEIRATAGQMTEQLADINLPDAAPDAMLTPEWLANAARVMKQEYDPRFGGFGNAPKFPRPTQPAFLLRHGVRHKDDDAIKMVLFTCDRMAAGGMYDQLGGGFARYSVDAEWLVPHFEKMLYDNAQLVHLYLDAHLVSGEKRFADVARDILRYVVRDMTHPEGGFYSAEDADSEGHEGKFYCWTKKELEQLLTADEAKVAIRHFGITEEGNFEDHSHPEPLKQQNVLSIVEPLPPLGGTSYSSPASTSGNASEKSGTRTAHPSDEHALLASAKQKMFNARAKRIRPHLDDKILASWNGLMLGAVARAGAVLKEEAYLKLAEKNAAFLKAKLWDAKTKTLYHRWRDGERDTVQLLEAYAYLLGGVIELYEATLKPEHLEFAIALADAMIAKFGDTKDGGFFQAPVSGDLIMRVKEDYDGAEPSGNSTATLALLRLAAITDNKTYREHAEKTLRVFAARMEKVPQAVPNLLLGLDWWLDEPKRVVITGDPASKEARALIHASHAVYQPNKVVLGNRGPVEPFARTLPEKDGPVAYLCTGTECKPPTNEAPKLQAMLK
jgi:uncharacterized protein